MRREELYLRDIVEAADHIANILVHAYFGVDWDIVWRTANNESAVLRAQIATILKTEFGEAGDVI